MKRNKQKKFLVMLLCITMIGTALLSSCGQKEEEEPPAPPCNVFTGATAEEGYDESAKDRRVVAFVVENHPDARPQWGMDDPEFSPDLVLQGEVEGGITRMLWLYDDYNKLPEIIGPTRSARPPFIIFSKFFDAVFVHWGMSHSKGEYIGASTIFKWYQVDHINQMTLDDKEELYGRDETRDVNVEHRGTINTSKLEATMKNEGVRMEPRENTKLYFNDVEVPAGETAATSVDIVFSDEAMEKAHWTYNEADGLYHTSDFENDFARENLLVLYDDTEYITKVGYEGPGSTGSVTYCNYKLSGGKALLFSKGTVKEIEWEADGNKFILKDPTIDPETAEAANEEAKAAAAEAPAEEPAEAEETEAEGDEAEGTETEEAEAKAPAYNKYVIVVPEPEEGEDAEAGDEAAAEEAETAESAEAADEEEGYPDNAYVAQNLNKGKTWIGWISKNHGGSVSSN